MSDKILYDFQILLMQQFGGISRYFYEVITGMSEDEVTVKLPVIGNLNYYFEDYFHKPVKEWNRKYYRHMWNLNCRYNNHVIRKSADAVFHPTAYNPYFIKNLCGKMVVTIHDMIHENFPEYYGGNPTIEHKKILMNRADAIIAVSQTTKDDIMRIYPYIPGEKIKVIRHGCCKPTEDEEMPSHGFIEKMKNYERFILYVGNRDRYKNFLPFAKAVCRIMQDQKELTFVCVGGGEFNEEEKELFERYGVEKRVLQDRSSDAELNWLYGHAVCFGFPSVSEGFGIPILEAFVRECPVVLSDIPCFREVAGEAGLFFDPRQENDIEEKLFHILDGTYREELIKRGKVRAEAFSWSKTAKEHQQLYKKVQNNEEIQ